MGFCFSKHSDEKKEKKPEQTLLIRQSIDIFGTPEYIKYSKKSHCEEIPEFLHRCKNFKDNFIGSIQDEIEALTIYATFISEEGESQVNISDEVRKKIERGLVEGRQLEQTIFDEGFQEVKKLGVVNFKRL